MISIKSFLLEEVIGVGALFELPNCTLVECKYGNHSRNCISARPARSKLIKAMPTKSLKVFHILFRDLVCRFFFSAFNFILSPRNVVRKSTKCTVQWVWHRHISRFIVIQSDFFLFTLAEPKEEQESGVNGGKSKTDPRANIWILRISPKWFCSVPMILMENLYTSWTKNSICLSHSSNQPVTDT